jgi:hypothetical protein
MQWQVSSQSSLVGLRHEVHHKVVWMYTENLTVQRALITYFFFNCWCLEIHSNNRIRHVPRCVRNRA